MALPTKTDIEKYQHPQLVFTVISRGAGGEADYSFGAEDIMAGSFRMDYGVGSGEFSPGGCVISSCKFTLRSIPGEIDTRLYYRDQFRVSVFYGPPGSQAAEDTLAVLGTFYVTDRSVKNGQIDITAMDSFWLADCVSFNWTAFREKYTGNTATIAQVFSEAGIQCGVLFSLGSPPFTGADIRIPLLDAEGAPVAYSDMTCRQVMYSCMLLSGNYAYTDTAGTIRVDWFNKSTEDDYNAIQIDEVFGYELKDPVQYTGVQVYGQMPTLLNDDSSRVFVLSDDAFLDESNCAAVQSRLYSALVGLSLQPASISAVFNPSIRPGMNIRVTVPMNGTQYQFQTPITSMTFNGSLSCAYVSDDATQSELDDIRTKQAETSRELAQNGGAASKGYVDSAVKGALGGFTGDLSGLVSGAIDEKLPEIEAGYQQYVDDKIKEVQTQTAGEWKVSDAEAGISVAGAIIPVYAKCTKGSITEKSSGWLPLSNSGKYNSLGEIEYVKPTSVDFTLFGVVPSSAFIDYILENIGYGSEFIPAEFSVKVAAMFGVEIKVGVYDTPQTSFMFADKLCRAYYRTEFVEATQKYHVVSDDLFVNVSGIWSGCLSYSASTLSTTLWGEPVSINLSQAKASYASGTEWLNVTYVLHYPGVNGGNRRKELQHYEAWANEFLPGGN